MSDLGGKIRKLHSQGLSYREITDKLGCSKDTMIKHLLKEKMPTRTKVATACKNVNDYDYVKPCNTCGERKPLSAFAKGKSYKDGRKNVCKKCHAEYVAKWYKDNPEKYALKVLQVSKYETNWRRHRLTEEQYLSLMNLYDGMCHSCKNTPATNIDHDHSCCPKSRSCGRCVRGVLCHHCNTALGLIRDSIETLQNMIEYLQQPLIVQRTDI